MIEPARNSSMGYRPPRVTRVSQAQLISFERRNTLTAVHKQQTNNEQLRLNPHRRPPILTASDRFSTSRFSEVDSKTTLSLNSTGSYYFNPKSNRQCFQTTKKIVPRIPSIQIHSVSELKYYSIIFFSFQGKDQRKQ